MPKLEVGTLATPEGLAQVIGQDRVDRMPPKAWKYHPWGHRVLILPDSIPEQIGSGLYIPETVRGRQQESVGAGVVIGVGPLVGQELEKAPHPGLPRLSDPRDLLYQHVLFTEMAGGWLRFFLSGRREWDQIPMILTDRDLWLWDSSPPEEWELKL